MLNKDMLPPGQWQFMLYPMQLAFIINLNYNLIELKGEESDDDDNEEKRSNENCFLLNNKLYLDI